MQPALRVARFPRLHAARPRPAPCPGTHKHEGVVAQLEQAVAHHARRLARQDVVDG